MNPPVLRAPNGVIADSNDYFGAGKPYFDPSKITVPTLLIGAEWDQDAPPYMSQTLFPWLVNSPSKRYVELAHPHDLHGEKSPQAIRSSPSIPRRIAGVVMRSTSEGMRGTDKDCL
jgi:pimeloyl-ACP methyl ester carboxylesterase